MISSPRTACELVHDGLERADAGHDEPVGLQRRGAVGRDLDLGAGALERLGRRVHVARTVVEQRRRVGVPVTARPSWTGCR